MLILWLSHEKGGFYLGLFLSWITPSGGSQQPRNKDTQAALWKSPHGEKLRPPTNHQLAGLMSKPPRNCIIQPQPTFNYRLTRDQAKTAKLSYS